MSDQANSKECQKFTSSLSSHGFSSSDFTIFNMASMQVKKQNHNLTNPCAFTFTYLLSAKWHIRTQGFVYQYFVWGWVISPLPLKPQTRRPGTVGTTCAVCNVSCYWLREEQNEQQNNAATYKNNGTAGFKGPVKIELRTVAGLLWMFRPLPPLTNPAWLDLQGIKAPTSIALTQPSPPQQGDRPEVKITVPAVLILEVLTFG